MQAHHFSWLSRHPHRTAEWLQEKLREGFDVHHLDGNHDNNTSSNLLLIEHEDHLAILHGSKTVSRLKRQKGKSNSNKRRLSRHRIEQIFNEYRANRNRIAKGMGPIYSRY